MPYGGGDAIKDDQFTARVSQVGVIGPDGKPADPVLGWGNCSRVVDIEVPVDFEIRARVSPINPRPSLLSTGKVKSGLGSNLPFWMMRIFPFCSATNRRWSEENSISVGASRPVIITWSSHVSLDEGVDVGSGPAVGTSKEGGSAIDTWGTSGMEVELESGPSGEARLGSGAGLRGSSV